MKKLDISWSKPALLKNIERHFKSREDLALALGITVGHVAVRIYYKQEVVELADGRWMTFNSKNIIFEIPEITLD